MRKSTGLLKLSMAEGILSLASCHAGRRLKMSLTPRIG